MKLWSLQTEKAYQKLEKTGTLRIYDDTHIEKSFIRAYDWLVGEMCKRVGAPPEGVRYPIWAWYQWEGKRNRRDLRCGGYAERGTPMVQLTIDIDDKHTLLSDFDEWHYVLNFWYLSLNERESNRFEAAYEQEGFQFLDMANSSITNPKIEKYRQQIIASWQRVFDIWKESPWCGADINQKSIQATFWELRMDQVLKVEHFIAK